jgi:hypothetical protein
MTETHIAGDLHGLSAHPGDIYHRAAMTVEALARERDEARAELASADQAYADAYEDGVQEGRSEAAGAHADLWSMLLRHFHKYGVEPASDDGDGHSAYQMMDALHEHEREVDMAHKAEVERLTKERDEARADASANSENCTAWHESALAHMIRADLAEARIAELEAALLSVLPHPQMRDQTLLGYGDFALEKVATDETVRRARTALDEMVKLSQEMEL